MSGSGVVTRRHWLAVLGFFGSAALLGAVLLRLDWAVFWSALQRLNAAPLVLAAAAVVGGLGVRGVRWRLITVRERGRGPDFVRATCIGYLGNVVFPLRAGEVLRILAVNRLAAVSIARAMTGAVADRALDALMLGVLLISVLVVHSPETVAANGVPVTLFLLAAAGAAVVAFAVWGQRWKDLIGRRLARLPGRWRDRTLRWYAEAVSVVSMFHDPGRFAVIAALTALAAALDYLVIWSVLLAFDWRLPLMAAITVGVFLNLGMLLPAAPGYIGIYQVACIFALGLYGIADSEAVAYSVVLQLLIIGVLAVTGGAALLSSGLRLAPGRTAEATAPRPQHRA